MEESPYNNSDNRDTPIDTYIFRQNNNENPGSVLSGVEKCLAEAEFELAAIEKDINEFNNQIPEKAKAYIQNTSRLANKLREVQNDIDIQLQQANKYEATFELIVNDLSEPLLKLRQLHAVKKYVKIYEVVTDIIEQLESAMKSSDMKLACTLYQKLALIFLNMNNSNLQLFVKFKQYLIKVNNA